MGMYYDIYIKVRTLPTIRSIINNLLTFNKNIDHLWEHDEVRWWKGKAMNENFEKFMDSLEAPTTKRVVKSYKDVCLYNYTNCTEDEVKQVILKHNPKSLKSIITASYVLGQYAKFIGDDNLCQIVKNIDRNALWEKAKPNAPKRFISHSDFEKVYKDIGLYEEFNGFYQQSLFRCVYEGIFNDDISVLKNLKASDIHENIVTLHEDNGHTYNLEITPELASDLKELGNNINTWERRNRFGSYEARIEGLYPDSCFKCATRDGSEKYAYRFSYYRILRKISKEYLGYSLLPYQNFISGVMYRICCKLKELGVDIEDTFSYEKRDRITNRVIEEELRRCNCNIEVRNFREMVRGDIEEFLE